MNDTLIIERYRRGRDKERERERENVRTSMVMRDFICSHECELGLDSTEYARMARRAISSRCEIVSNGRSIYQTST